MRLRRRPGFFLASSTRHCACLAALAAGLLGSFAATPTRAQGRGRPPAAPARPPAGSARGAAPQPTPAPPLPSSPDTDPLSAAVIVMGVPGQKERISIAYQKPVTDAQMKEDFAALSRELRSAPVSPTISRSAPHPSLPPIPAAEGEIAGLVDWSKGVLNLEAIGRTLRRFPHLRVTFLLLGRFNLTAPVGDQQRGAMRWRTQAVPPSTFNYDLWNDQQAASGRSPIPGLGGLAWPWIVGLAAGALLLAGGLGYLVYLLRRPA